MTGHRLIAALGLALALATAMPVAAQSVAAPPQVVTLDQDRLYFDSQYGKALEARALAANQALAAENRKIEADLAVEEAELTKKRPTMQAAAFQALADAFDAKVEQRRGDQAAKIEALKAQHDAGRKTFFQAVVPVLADMMRQMGAYAMLNRDAVVLSFDAIDVTDRAIKAVDEKVGDGSALPNGPRLPGPAGQVPGQTSADGYAPGTLQQDTPTLGAPGLGAPNMGTPTPENAAPENATPSLPDPTLANPTGADPALPPPANP